MRETFPVKKPGDPLSAGHVNKLSRVCRDVAAGGFGSHTNQINLSFGGASPASPFHMVQVKVIDQNTHSDGTYNVRFRYYDHDASEWKDDTDRGPFIMDNSAGSDTFADGSIATAYWHAQRKAFIPLSGASTVLKVGKASGSIGPGAIDGEVRVWDKGEQTDDLILDVYHDWITGDFTINDGDEVIIGWFKDEGVWRVIGAECPPE